MSRAAFEASAHQLLGRAEILRQELGGELHDRITEAIYGDARSIASRALSMGRPSLRNWDLSLDRLLTSRIFGFPIMLLLLTAVFWVTIQGANVPSGMLASAFFWLEERLAWSFQAVGAPWWVEGFLVHGVYRGLGWVVAVMLPPMAIFFPIFTFLEDLGYLPRVAFNLDRFFRWAGADGRQALTMSMGFGCNAAGVISTRIISSPRERLIAIITNNFVPCNGRWPTIIMLASLFVAASFPAGLASLAAAATVVGVSGVGLLVPYLAEG
jgi:ferrous iron transport protein B